MEIKEEDIKVNVCHKCGLVRDTKPKIVLEQFGLHDCNCIGQSWFGYEAKERTVEEAKEIAHLRYLEYVKLFRSQGRDSLYFKRLADEYGESSPLIF